MARGRERRRQRKASNRRRQIALARQHVARVFRRRSTFWTLRAAVRLLTRPPHLHNVAKHATTNAASSVASRECAIARHHCGARGGRIVERATSGALRCGSAERRAAERRHPKSRRAGVNDD